MNLHRVLPLSFALAGALACFSMAAPTVAAREKQASADSGVLVSEETLDAYVGTYATPAGFEIKVWREGEQLVLQASGQAAWPLLGISETMFRVPSMDAKITFGANAAGDTDHLVLLMDGRETKALR